MYKADEGVLTSSSLTETESERGLFRLRERERRAREKSQREEPERLGRWTFLRRLAPMAGSVFAGEFKAEILQKSEPGHAADVTP